MLPQQERSPGGEWGSRSTRPAQLRKREPQDTRQNAWDQSCSTDTEGVVQISKVAQERQAEGCRHKRSLLLLRSLLPEHEMPR